MGSQILLCLLMPRGCDMDHTYVVSGLFVTRPGFVGLLVVGCHLIYQLKITWLVTGRFQDEKNLDPADCVLRVTSC